MKKTLEILKPHIMAFIVLLLVTVVYFLPQFQGKQLSMGDIVNYENMAKEAKDYNKETGDIALWTNSIFCGMPTYQITGAPHNNLLKHVFKAFKLGISAPAGYFIFGMMFFYLSLILLGVNHWFALLGALCFGFSTNHMVLYDAGHMTKVKTIFMSAPIIAGVLLTFRKNYLVGGLLFALSFGLNVMMSHPQMTYYLGLCLAMMVAMFFVTAIQNKEWLHFGKAVSILLLGVILGLGSSASSLWTTYEYGQETMRGKPILTNTDEFSSSSSDGLAWNYAMSFSNEKKDLLVGLIPLAIGGGSQELLDKDSNVAKDLKRKGVNVRKGIPSPTYWGALPINGGPQYFGAAVCLFFILSLFVLRGPIRWWGMGAVLFTFFLSLGHNMEWFNRFFFDYIPWFNKFRTPNSVISVTTVIIPLIGILGLEKFINDKNDDMKPLYYASGVLVAICVIFGLGGSLFFDFSSASDVRMEQVGFNIDALIADRKSMLFSSSLQSLFIVLLSTAVLYVVKKKKLKALYGIIILALIVTFDLMSVGSRYLSQDDFISKRNYKTNFQPRPVDEQILADTDLSYRVLDLSINTFNSSQASYFHKTIGGYHAAKLQRIQDVIDRHITQNNQQVLNMLNTKYIISKNGGGRAIAQLNPASLGNAWFINNIEIVENADAEINALTDFDPAGDAIIHREFSNYINGFDPQKEGNIDLTSYTPNTLVYQSNSSSEQLAVFSEVWYGPNKGWEAYIDGQKVEHIRANYMLRALRIPAGKHTIKFDFNPRSFILGETISLISSSLIIIGILGLFLFGIWQYRKRGKSK